MDSVILPMTLCRVDVRKRQILAFEQKGFAGGFRQSIGEAITEVECRPVVSPAESSPGPARAWACSMVTGSSSIGAFSNNRSRSGPAAAPARLSRTIAASRKLTTDMRQREAPANART